MVRNDFTGLFSLNFDTFFIDLLLDRSLVYIYTMTQKTEDACLLVFSKIKAL